MYRFKLLKKQEIVNNFKPEATKTCNCNRNKFTSVKQTKNNKKQ